MIHSFFSKQQIHVCLYLIKISKYIKGWQLHFLGMLTGQAVEKQIEGWKKRNTWSQHNDPDPIWEEYCGIFEN